MYSRLITCLLATSFLSNVALAGSSGHVLRQRSGILSKQHRRALKVKRQNDAQTTLDLDPSQLMPNQQLTGQETPAAGQVDSLTSVNGFINYCLTQDVPLTDGKQIPGGSCNQTPIGEIIATDKMPSAIFSSPPNGGTIKSNTDFTIDMVVTNIATGNKVNTKNSWMAAPQQLNSNGIVLGYSNFIIEEISSLNSSDALDTSKFVFFKAVSTAAQGGVLSTTVKGGLPAGTYKVSSNNVAANGQPVLVAVAQHGTLDACNYFFVTDDGEPVEIPTLTGDAASASASATGTASETATDVSATATATGSAATETATDAATATGSAADETATESAADETATETAADETATATASEADTTAAASATSAAAESTSVSTRRGRGGNKSQTNRQGGGAASTATEAAATSAAAETSEAADATSEAATATAEASASEVTSAAQETETATGRRGGGRGGRD